MADRLRDLVEQARAGDPAAFEELYERFERSVYSLCYHLLGNEHEAADAAQETFVNAFEQLPRLRHVAAFTAWLRRATINTCRHQRRKRRWLRWFSEADEADRDPDERPDPGPAVDHDLSRAETERAVRAALAKLSPAHREVIVLHHLEELPLQEIADTLGVAVGTVKSRLGRAREHLERLLTPYVEDE